MEVNMLVPFTQKTPAAKVHVYISKLNTEMIDRLRHLVLRQQAETVKISGCHTKGYACLMGEYIRFSTINLGSQRQKERKTIAKSFA